MDNTRVQPVDNKRAKAVEYNTQPMANFALNNNNN